MPGRRKATTPDTPDEVLIDRAMDGRLTLNDLNQPERIAVVARLTRRGQSASQIALALGCTHRTVQRLRAQGRQEAAA